jgi:hypothetical protein
MTCIHHSVRSPSRRLFSMAQIILMSSLVLTPLLMGQPVDEPPHPTPDVVVNPPSALKKVDLTTEGVAQGQSQKKAKTVAPRLLIISDLIGYIEPCGCTIDLKLGGIDRAVHLINELRAQGPTALLVVGSHLFEYPEVKPHQVAQEEAKAQLIRGLLSILKVDAFVPGPNDLARGGEFYRTLSELSPLPDVTINHTDGAPKLITLGGVKIGIFGIVDPQSTLSMRSDQPALAIGDTAQRTAKDLRARGAHVVIGMASIDRALLRKLARRTEGVDLWILGRHPQEETALSPVEGRSSFIVEAGDRGRNLGSLQLIDAQREGALKDPHGDRARKEAELKLKIKMKERFGGASFGESSPFGKGSGARALKDQLRALSLTPPKSDQGKQVRYTLIPIKEDLPRDQSIKDAVQDFQAGLKELNLSVAGQVKPLPDGASGYAGNKECKQCHVGAQKFWETTKHAKAWETLVKADKTFDVDCVGCHVTGWQKPGGSALGHTEGLQDVQCEACHGPSAKHAEVGGGEAWTKRVVPISTCETCHNKHHSPKFDNEAYRKSIIGPGHGLPLPIDSE